MYSRNRSVTKPGDNLMILTVPIFEAFNEFAIFFLVLILKKFWTEAALTSVYTINRLSSSLLQNTSLFERLYGTSPNYSNLKAFGCACFVFLHPHERTKLEPRARLCCFLGYGTEHKGFR